MKIGESDIKRIQRSNGDGPKETITRSYDADGNEVDVTYHVQNPDGERVTIHGDEALVERPDGSMSFFKLSGTEFKLFDGVVSASPGEVRDLEVDDPRIEEDRALIESARVMFARASESQEGFEEVDDIF